MSLEPTLPIRTAAANDLPALAGQAAVLAERLARLATSGAVPPFLTGADRARAVRHYLDARQVRVGVLPEELFTDPAWDILLGLFTATLEGTPQSVAAARAAAGVAPTTAMRWLKRLEELGCVERTVGPDGALLCLPQTVFDAIAGWVDRWLVRAE